MKLHFNILFLFSFFIFNVSCQSVKKWISKNPDSPSKRSIASRSNSANVNFEGVLTKEKAEEIINSLTNSVDAKFKDAKWCSTYYGDKYNKKMVVSRAEKYNHFACMEYLIKEDRGYLNELNQWCRGKYGNTKADISKALVESPLCVKYLFKNHRWYAESCTDKHGDTRTGFLNAVKENSSCLDYFFNKHRGYINAPLDNKGTRALMLARNNPEMTQKLLNAGAKPNLRDSKGWTSLHWAVISANLEVVRKLLRAGADPNLQDDQGNSALILVLLNYYQVIYHNDTIHIVKTLLKANRAKPNLKNRRGYNAVLALAIALKKSSPKNLFPPDNRTYSAPYHKTRKAVLLVMNELYLSGVNFNAQDNEGKTFLIHLSEKRGNPLGRFLNFFRNYKIDPNIQDHSGRTILMNTARGNYKEAVQFLLERGADPNIRDNQGRRALEYVPYTNRGGQLTHILSKVTNLHNPYAKPLHKRESPGIPSGTP